MNLVERQKISREVFAGKMLHVYNDEVILPDENIVTREYIRHVGAVAVVPLTDDGNVIMERQFRYPVDDVVLEIPAGKLDSKDENRLFAAKRELQEETGVIADEWIELGNYYGAPAYSDEKITLYLAKGLHKGEAKLDEDEFLTVEIIPLRELVSMIKEGIITDGKTQVAILKTAVMEGLL